MTGYKRHALAKCQQLLDWYPCILILGARQTGKTTLAKALGGGGCWSYLDLEQMQDLERLRYDPAFYFSEYPEQVIIDEAQEWPEVFKVLRGVIDAHRQQKGRFIITGSSSPNLLRQASETLAGRVGIMQLGTLKCSEYYAQSLSPFYTMFQQSISHAEALTVISCPPITSIQVQQFWLHGGYPEPCQFDDQVRFQQWMSDYQQTYINRDVAKLFPKLNRHAYLRFVIMLAKLSGTILNKSEIARAVEVSEKSIRDYLEIADGTYLWRTLTSFERNISKSIIKSPKGYLRDSGLLHYLLRISDLEQLKFDPIVGASFEGFVCEEILKGMEYTQISNWSAHYYRTRNGAEIDLILTGTFGTLPIEIKYGTSVKTRSLATLSNFLEEHKLPLGLVINNAPHVEKLTDKIIQVPVGCI